MPRKATTPKLQHVGHVVTLANEIESEMFSLRFDEGGKPREVLGDITEWLGEHDMEYDLYYHEGTGEPHSPEFFGETTLEDLALVLTNVEALICVKDLDAKKIVALKRRWCQ